MPIVASRPFRGPARRASWAPVVSDDGRLVGYHTGPDDDVWRNGLRVARRAPLSARFGRQVARVLRGALLLVLPFSR